MNESDPIARKRTDPGPTYILLGRDTDGASHVYRTMDEWVYAILDGERVQRFALVACTVDDYVKFVRDEMDDPDWKNRRYVADEENPFAVFIDQPTDATEVAT
jgi:hypothetical protein